MSEKRIVAPSEMLDAATQAATAFDGRVSYPPFVKAILEAALRWQRDAAPKVGRNASIIAEWLSDMYDMLEPEIPEEIADILWDAVPTSDEHNDPVSLHNTLILAAYLRGQKAGKL